MVGDDLAPFFVPGEFAGTADTLDGEAVVGIFDGAYVSAGAGLGMSDTRPVYLLPAADVPEGVVGMALVANSLNFNVVNTELDNGTILLILECA
jgi:hypothetical protein